MSHYILGGETKISGLCPLIILVNIQLSTLSWDLQGTQDWIGDGPVLVFSSYTSLFRSASVRLQVSNCTSERR
jgi:hypothetical protein